MDLLMEISEVLQKGMAPKVRELTSQAIDNGVSPKKIMDALISGMTIIGVKFKNNEVYVPEVLIAARAMNAGLDLLRPLLEETGVEPTGKVIIGTVKGDLHDIGKNLVKMMMVGAGFDVIDLGVDVPPEKFVEAFKIHHPQIIAMSALLTTTMPSMENTIQKLKEEQLRDKVIVMIGGAPVTDNFRQQIGADYYTPDAATAAEKAREVLCV